MNASFIDRSIWSPTALNVGKGMIWGNVVALSQALGTAFYEHRAEARAAGHAVDVEAIKKLAWQKTTVFWPSIVAHTVAFTLIRANFEDKHATGGLVSGIAPLAIVAAPSVAYAAFYRSVPPQALRFGAYSAALLHLYDRVVKPHGLHEENMPTVRMNRRLW